jgi:putative transposase
MPRRPRICPAGVCFHVLNRAVARLPLFEKDEDYLAFERVLQEAFEREPLPIFAYCVMPNHWHFVVRGETKYQVSDFFRWLTHTHTMRWHAHHRTSGTGHLYQGRFKTFPLEEDEHLLAVLRYVERNPLRANLCNLAEAWRYSSAWRRTSGDQEAQSLLAPWPVPRPRQWRHYVNKPQSEAEVAAIRTSVQRGTPYGTETWVSQAAARLKLKHTLRPRGRPPKK